MKIIHAIAKIDPEMETIRFYYRNSKNEIVMPAPFANLLTTKIAKWNYKYDLPFTMGYDKSYAAISITDPRDHFSRKLGYKIVTGRLNHANQGLYETLPNTVYRVETGV